MKETEQHIIFPITGRIGIEQNKRVFTFDEETQATEEITDRFHTYLGLLSRIHSQKEFQKQGFSIDALLERMRYLLRKELEQDKQTLLSILREYRAKSMNVFLNTPGGHGAIGDKYSNEIITHRRIFRSATTNFYVKEASSIGAHIFLDGLEQGFNIHLGEDSTVYFHLGFNLDDGITEEIREEFDEIRKRLLTLASEDTRGTLLSKFDEAASDKDIEDNGVTLSGEEIFTFFAHRGNIFLHADIFDLEELFVRNTGIAEDNQEKAFDEMSLCQFFPDTRSTMLEILELLRGTKS